MTYAQIPCLAHSILGCNSNSQLLLEEKTSKRRSSHAVIRRTVSSAALQSTLRLLTICIHLSVPKCTIVDLQSKSISWILTSLLPQRSFGGWVSPASARARNTCSAQGWWAYAPTYQMPETPTFHKFHDDEWSQKIINAWTALSSESVPKLYEASKWDNTRTNRHQTRKHIWFTSSHSYKEVPYVHRSRSLENCAFSLHSKFCGWYRQYFPSFPEGLSTYKRFAGHILASSDERLYIEVHIFKEIKHCTRSASKVLAPTFS